MARPIRRLWFGLALLLLPGLLSGCSGGLVPTLAVAAAPARPPTSTPAALRLLPPTWTPTPPPTVTPLPSATPSPTVPPTRRQLRVFDQLYALVRDSYVYPDYNGLNWLAWGVVYREQVAAGLSDEQFYRGLAELVTRLDDGHSVYQSPAAATVTQAIIAGRYQGVGLGLDLAARQERSAAVVLRVYPAGPAWQAGLRAHDSLLALDGAPILPLLDQLDGPAGTLVQLTVQSPGGAPRPETLRRAPLASPPAVTAYRRESDNLLVVTLHTLWDGNTGALLRQTLRAQDPPPAGLILDLRTNRGGSEANLLSCLAPFTHGTLGYFVRRDNSRPLQVAGVDLQGSQTLPLVLLVGYETSSYAEVLAGVLQASGRARLVGAVTRGNVETIWPHDFEDGSRLWLAEESFRPVSGTVWERNGVVPDYIVPGDWADFTTESDLQLATAIQLLAPAP